MKGYALLLAARSFALCIKFTSIKPNNMPTKKSLPIKKAATKKKEVKKVLPKVAPPKKASAAGAKKKPLVMVSGEACFWVNNGPALCSMKDLRDILRTLSDEQFLYHTAMGRNDFSAWVKDVLGDKKCATELTKAKNMKEALSAVEKHLKTYSI